MSNSSSPRCNNYADLKLARLAYARVAVRAQKAWALLHKLHNTTIEVSCTLLEDTLVQAILYNRNFDAYEAFEGNIEAFKRELVPTLHSKLLKTPDGRAYQLKPFFGEYFIAELPNLMSLLGLGYLRPRAISEFKALNVCVDASVEAIEAVLEPQNLLSGELAILTQHYVEATRQLVNVLRDAATALTYLVTAVVRDAPAIYVAANKPEDIPSRLEAIKASLELPLEPRPAAWFGSEAMRINPLRTLAEPDLVKLAALAA